MHAVAIRKDVLEQNPWLAEAVFNAYSQAKQLTYDYLLKSAWYKTSLPWVTQEMEETRALMGKNYWPYGIEPNREALTALFRYSHEQGFSARELTIEELFHPFWSTFDRIVGIGSRSNRVAWPIAGFHFLNDWFCKPIPGNHIPDQCQR